MIKKNNLYCISNRFVLLLKINLVNPSVLYSLSLFSLSLFFFYKKKGRRKRKGKERKGIIKYIV
jgi:hypothetical protein